MARNSDSVIDRIRNISKYSGSKYRINIKIESNGKGNEDDPAYYGKLHNEGNYPFTRPVLQHFRTRVLGDEELINEIKKMYKDGRVKYHQRKAAIIMAKAGYDDVMEYLLYTMPQRPQPWKKDGRRNLYETGLLWDSIYSEVSEARSGRKVWRGK